MRIRSLAASLALAFTFGLVSCLPGAGATAAILAQERRTGEPNISPEEQRLAQGIMSAPDLAAKLKAAAELIKKYPKTALRPGVAGKLADQIAGVADASQKISLAQDYQKIFNELSEQEIIMPVLVEGYAGANRPDEAFSAGSEFLTRNRDALRVLVGLLLVGTEQAKRNNAKFVPQSLQYGEHAIVLIEADKKPADMNDAGWKQYKTSMLPALYQSMGILNLVKGDRAETKARLAKAAELAPSDPFNYLLLAGVLNDEYQDGATRYKSMPEGQAKNDELQKTLLSLDKVIDAYAHLIALSEGVERLQAVRQQYLQDLESYYKYRHHNSTDGMQSLIDKYKVAAKP